MNRWLSLAFPLALALGVAPLTVSAQPQPTETDRAEARRHFNLALGYITQSRWRDAIRELEETRRTVTTPAVLYNLGLAHRALGEHRAAIASFREFLRLAGDRRDVEGRAEAVAFISELEAALGRVSVVTEPPDASVTLDGEALSGSREGVALDPGAHTLTASAPGYEPASRTFESRAGERQTVTLRLGRLAARVRVESSVPDATVSLDDRVVGRGTVELPAPPGPHRVRVRADGYAVFETDVTTQDGRTVTVTARLTPRGTSLVRSPWLWVGVGAAAVVGAVILGVALSQDAGEAVVPDPWGQHPTALTLGGEGR